MDSCVLAAHELLALDVSSKIQSRNMQCVYARDASEAQRLALGFVKPGYVVAWGGSTTLKELGINDALRSDRSIVLLDRDRASTPEARAEIDRQAFSADLYFCGTNAIAATGELVNIDGNANRVAALAFGPKRVVIVASVHKIMPSLDAAIERARNIAAPANAIRFSCSTPCTTKGRCFDCKSPQTVCSQILLTRFSAEKDRIVVILVGGEPLGY